jgi:O-antigen ligase/GT2 family glycosyltransferase
MPDASLETPYPPGRRARSTVGVLPWALGLCLALTLGIVASQGPKIALEIVALAAFSSLTLLGFAAIFAAWTVSFFIPFFAAGNALLKVGLILAAVGFLVTWSRNSQSLRSHIRAATPFLLVGSLFLAWLAMTLLWAPESHSAVSQLWKYGICLGIFTALILALDSERQVRLVVGAFVVGALLTAVCGLVGLNTGPVNSLPGESRLQGGIGDPNVLAAAVLAAIPLAAGLLAYARRPIVRLLWLAAIPILALAAAGTGSRGGATATIVVLVTALVVMRGDRGSVVAIALGALGAAAAWMASNPAGLHRLTNFKDHGNGRDELWRIAWEMMASHPLQGVGLENFVHQAPEYVLRPGRLVFVHLITEKPVVVHNTYLQFLAETGVVGFLLFASVVTLSLTACLRAAGIYERMGNPWFARLCRCIFLAAIALLATGFFVSSAVDYKLWTVLALGPVVFLMAPRSAIAPHDVGPRPIRPEASPVVRSAYLRVAVVIPCYNDGATVEAALRSLEEQEPCQVVIVDDGSDDPETLRTLDRLRAAGTKIVRQENQGLAAARMRGVAETTAPYVQPLDADDMLASNSLRPLADALDAEPDLGMVWGDHRMVGEVDLVQRRAPALDPWAITYANRLTEGLIRRTALLDAGGWVLEVGFEDWDLYMGLAERGWRGRRVPVVTYLYRISSSRMLSTARKHHDQLYAQMRERHAPLFRARRANWRRSMAPLMVRLLLPVVGRLPVSEFTRHRIASVVFEPTSAIRARFSRRAVRRASG